MGILPARRTRLTYEHYLLFPEDGKQHEIIEGEHYMSPAPETAHQGALGNLYVIMFNYLRRRRLGTVFFAPVDVLFSNTNVVQPDLVYVSKQNAGIITKQNIRGTPDLLVEVRSPGTAKYDLTLKKNLYARFGVKEYWIVDPAERTIEVFRLGSGGYGRAKKFGRKDRLQVALIPGLAFAVREVFA